MQEITTTELADLLADDTANTLLLDVREAPELEIASIPDAVHIPMGEIPGRLDELDPDKTIICMCHLGGRSAQVTAFLSSRGYPRVANLTGGIDDWSQSVDSSVPRY